MECGKAYCIDMLGAILAYSWQQVESARAKFVVRMNTAESEEYADDCDSLLTETLERQGGAEALQFQSFRDLNSDVATSPDLTDSEIVATVMPREVEDDENDDDDSDDIEADPDPTGSKPVSDGSCRRRDCDEGICREKRPHGEAGLHFWNSRLQGLRGGN
ncbi:hypothetical protein HPB50_002524 [Hyalomma asiaticum]|uniref:Uncharacterized protein n=1 Tax=Hyalomma asiaticum TaxID=266040 RepID=A0ACB7TBR2_HYAAI|nr:hypothetical protein HPB50_002524 [Hyalomma asiaticum]